MLLGLEDIKDHLNIDQSWHGDDKLLISYLNIAEGFIKDYCDNPELEDFSTSETAPEALKGACLLLIADLYNNREKSISGTMKDNPTFEMLMRPYMHWRAM